MNTLGKLVLEVQEDAEASARTTNWEKGFLASLAAQVEVAEQTKREFTISDKQQEVLDRIQTKLYITG